MQNRAGLTLVEFFVVLAIISTLIALLIPAVQSARRLAQETVCKNNLHQLNLAVGQFAEVHKKLPLSNRPGYIGGWAIEILPFLEQRALAESITGNLLIAQAPPQLQPAPTIFRCPLRPDLKSSGTNLSFPAHYVLIPTSRRDSFLLFDAPNQVNVPWFTSPESSYATMQRSKGPHHDGFYFSRGFQQGISLMIDGKIIQ